MGTFHNRDALAVRNIKRFDFAKHGVGRETRGGRPALGSLDVSRDEAGTPACGKKDVKRRVNVWNIEIWAQVD
jgi:hypothetical protein